ncbi:hypothetical protein GGH91_002644 [Coemansia sp. RSA 2671]|uniref:Uncharacterized protein n=1 Tax=Coemansia linderi TaxID=2663919 RepID=A0ACC1JQD4_9FUNG|nr:hypothetical protein LPJ60_002080 [Coemansia sp. RSA 2675]KAJ2345103.1 hypothetical protein GGH91_002644 [Coemansia sp. RSA 2671]KAJ2765387.1 hypothetical protein GGI18_006228 [Coemansia linderi]
MESNKPIANPLRRSSSPPPSPPNRRRLQQPPNLGRLAVQCLDPDLKREALSELFDHCMTPISAQPPTPMRCMSSPPSSGEGTVRMRPLSAAPLLFLDMAKPEAVEPVNTGLLSPASPPISAEQAFYGQYYGDEEEDEEDEGVQQEMQAPALGTFADLRRKLYGGDVHGTATTAEA